MGFFSKRPTISEHEEIYTRIISYHSYATYKNTKRDTMIAENYSVLQAQKYQTVLVVFFLNSYSYNLINSSYFYCFIHTAHIILTNR